jgi:lipopolysaccharide biosynthesis glycosyltransferase
LVYCWPESTQFCEKICAVPEISARCIECEPIHNYRAKNAQESSKIPLIAGIKDFDMVVYLDADTIIRKSLEPLIQAAADSPTGFAATQFGSWRMHQGVPRARVGRMLGIDPIPEEYVHKALNPEAYSYNSGVFATRPNSVVLPDWGVWTYAARNIYISGETTLHAIAQKYQITTLENGVFNNSPMYQSKLLKDEDVAIWHFHGDCNTRPDKSKKGVDIWLPEFKKVFDANMAGVQTWWSMIRNKFLPGLIGDGFTA